MAVWLGDGQNFAFHGGIGFAVTFAANGPAIHVFGHMAERRDFADLIQIFDVLTATERQHFSSGVHGLYSFFGSIRIALGCGVFK